MRLSDVTTRTKYTRIGVPAAVVGVLASSLTAAPANAAVATEAPPIPARTGTIPLPSVTARAVPTTAAPNTYTVQPGDTVYGIADSFGLAAVDVLTWNGLGWRSVIYPGQTLILTAPAPAPAAAPAPATTHTVVAGDTVFAIAQRNGTTVDAILAANGLGQGAIIYPGQSLIITAAAPAASAAPAAPTPDASTSDASTPSAALSAPQAENAALIIRIGRELGVSDRGIAIALGTSMVESWMRNLDWGDRDSVGLFQQRTSTGWGTHEQIMDRDHAIRAFFTGASNADGTITRGLLDISGWESMSFAEAAQAVQISAYPERYAPWEAAAYEWLALYG
ncbi:LysM peptidoglycan-binding domain-containing protein [Microbacterium sp.]|uniref:LysM peptidoglycan-binding domain-containing protein n=1 Tax=Microbacterium sp. TaxID=51671 RepID=UPI003F9C947D